MAKDEAVGARTALDDLIEKVSWVFFYEVWPWMKQSEPEQPLTILLRREAGLFL